MLFQNAGLYKIDSIFSRQQENDSNVLCINDVWIEIKQLTSSFMKQQEEVVLSDLPIFGIISTKGQSFHTVEALVVIVKTALNICGRFFCMKIIF